MKAILLQEVATSVANSLQIIASVLMQGARKVQSEEARRHLQDAHHRVMSIAALQRHLAVSSLGDVAVRHYFVQLCESLAVSMIPDPSVLSIEVTADDSVVAANKSVSLGLIVTELVINALKHAFPAHTRGKILVGYRSNGPDWTLSVEDDGVGMPTGNQRAKAGLGTGIIEALAKHLGATIQVQAETATRIWGAARQLQTKGELAALRAYLRQRERLLDYSASHIQHMQKALTQMNVQLHHVVTDMTGETGMRIIRAVVAG